MQLQVELAFYQKIPMRSWWELTSVLKLNYWVLVQKYFQFVEKKFNVKCWSHHEMSRWTYERVYLGIYPIYIDNLFFRIRLQCIATTQLVSTRANKTLTRRRWVKDVYIDMWLCTCKLWPECHLRKLSFKLSVLNIFQHFFR